MNQVEDISQQVIKNMAGFAKRHNQTFWYKNDYCKLRENKHPEDACVACESRMICSLTITHIKLTIEISNQMSLISELKENLRLSTEAIQAADRYIQVLKEANAQKNKELDLLVTMQKNSNQPHH